MRKKLLLADDSITIQKVVELTFPQDEFEVVTAGNGRIAVDKAMTFLPDVVLCDVIMPQLDGYQVCEALRASESLKNVPILLLNGAFEPYDADRAKAVGALGNVSKPFDPPALVARVKEILAARNTGTIDRPTQPMTVEALETLSVPDTSTVDAGVHEAAAHAYAYDETETHPVSTVEVPMGVREMAARSLSLDAPVFAAPEPDVLTTETEPADFAETLHGPLDAEVPGAMVEHSMETHSEEVEAIEEIDPIVTTAEVESPIHATEADAHEPIEFDADTPLHEELPSTLPPMSAVSQITAISTADAGPAPIEEFSGEHEFEPHELDTPIATPEPVAAAEPMPSLPEPEPEPMPAPVAVEPEAMAVPEPVAELEPEPLPEPVADAPEPLAAAPVAEAPIALPEPEPEPEPAPIEAAPVELPAAAPFVAGVAAAVAASSTGLSGLVDLQPESEVEPEPLPAVASASTSNGAVPSAEVAVPVDMVQQIAQRVISQVSERVIREIAWDVIPGLAEKLIKAEIERIKARAESERD